MPREKEYFRETVEHLLILNNGKIEDSDVGWRKTLKMGRRCFDERFGQKISAKRSVYEIAKKLL